MKIPRTNRRVLVAVLSACMLPGHVGCRTSMQRDGFRRLTPPGQPLVAVPPQDMAGKVKEVAAESARLAGLTILAVLCLGFKVWADSDDE